MFHLRQSKTKFLNFNEIYFRAPILIVLFSQGLLLIFSNFKTSLMAHDEGWYTTLALGMVQSQDWLSPTWWGDIIYDKTSGLHWLIATALSTFSVNETSARLPSGLACLISVSLIYSIGACLLNKTAALLGGICLSTVFIWTQYGQLATQDMPLIGVELICIWTLLKAEEFPRHKHILGLISGLCFGAGFFVKGFMVVLPSLALLPYLVFEHRRHRHLLNPGLYIGLLTGSAAVLYWFLKLWQTHGELPFQQLFGILILAASDDYHGVGPLYYLWNIPTSFLPWTPIALLGIFQISRPDSFKRKWLLMGYPACLMLMLQIFPTKTLYYPLQIYPFLALYAGFCLSKLIDLKCQASKKYRGLLKLISLFYGSAGLLLLIVNAVLMLFISLNKGFLGLEKDPKISIYVLMTFAIGISWVGVFWLGNKRLTGNQFNPLASAKARVASLLIGPWLAISIAGMSGLIGDYNPDIKTFFRQPKITEILNQNVMDVVIKDVDRESHKMWILASFYANNWGENFSDLNTFPGNHYGWVSPEFSEEISSGSTSKYEIIGTIRDWNLVRKNSDKPH